MCLIWLKCGAGLSDRQDNGGNILGRKKITLCQKNLKCDSIPVFFFLDKFSFCFFLQVQSFAFNSCSRYSLQFWNFCLIIIIPVLPKIFFLDCKSLRQYYIKSIWRPCTKNSAHVGVPTLFFVQSDEKLPVHLPHNLCLVLS